MRIISLEGYIKGINIKIESIEDDISNAIKNEWYEKAARLSVKVEALKLACFLAGSGDYDV